MPSYVFTDKAEHDLEKIIDFTVEHWGTLQAILYIDGLEEIAQTLAKNPDIGLKREALFTGLLSFPYQRHILYYTKELHGVSIIRVLHASMDSVKHIK
ncbi:MAG: type II toxin-antitoxin system RelE/ParE family toxin [Gammaproteobacteria bacterium]|nr:type II toxin-antitoxin system RelE/ParE family toxin [Gammaproteobacteria bacterium]